MTELLTDLQKGHGARDLPHGAPSIARGAPRCDDPNHCITCSDEGVPMRVVSRDADDTLAWCENENGERSEVLTALIENPVVGDLLLVHAGTALLRISA